MEIMILESGFTSTKDIIHQVKKHLVTSRHHQVNSTIPITIMLSIQLAISTNLLLVCIRKSGMLIELILRFSPSLVVRVLIEKRTLKWIKPLLLLVLPLSVLICFLNVVIKERLSNCVPLGLMQFSQMRLRVSLSLLISSQSLSIPRKTTKEKNWFSKNHSNVLILSSLSAAQLIS